MATNTKFFHTLELLAIYVFTSLGIGLATLFELVTESLVAHADADEAWREGLGLFHGVQPPWGLEFLETLIAYASLCGAAACFLYALVLAFRRWKRRHVQML